MRRLVIVAVTAAFLCLAGSSAVAGEAPAEEFSELRGIRIDLKEHRLTVEGTVCLAEGVLEYLAVVEGGKEYESVLALKCRASGLHAALLLIGGKPGCLDPKYIEDAPPLPDAVKPPDRKGDGVDIIVRWREGDEAREAPATLFLLDRATNRPAGPTSWIFTGSYFVKDPESGRELYMANLDGTLVASFYDPAALLNLAAAAGNPYRGDRLGFALNTDAVPPKGTPVEVVFQLIKSDMGEAPAAVE